MDTRSVTCPPLPSTRAVIAGAHLCDQVSALLLVEPKVSRQTFLGEPVEEVMAMVKLSFTLNRTSPRSSTPSEPEKE